MSHIKVWGGSLSHIKVCGGGENFMCGVRVRNVWGLADEEGGEECGRIRRRGRRVSGGK